MKAIIITQSEPFYIPLLLEKVLREYKEVVAIITLPRTQKKFELLSSAKELKDVFGWKYTLSYGTLFVYYKALDLLNRCKKLGRFYSIKSLARTNHIPVYKQKNINERQSLNMIKEIDPEIIISVAAPQIFKKEIIGLPKYIINAHAALLPEYRGRMPSFWVLSKGEEKTGVTVHYIDENIDTGNIIVQETIEICREETLHSLQTKVSSVGAEAVLKALKIIEEDSEYMGAIPAGKGSYYSFPTKEAVKEFKARGRRFI